MGVELALTFDSSNKFIVHRMERALGGLFGATSDNNQSFVLLGPVDSPFVGAGSGQEPGI